MTEDTELFSLYIEIETDSELSRAYKENPTNKNYLYLRAKHPDKEIEVALFGGIEWAEENAALLKRIGIKKNLIHGVLDADLESISAVSIILMQNIEARNTLIEEGETHLISRKRAISDSTVNYIIALMFDSLSWNSSLILPRELIVLNRHQLLGTEIPKLKKKEKIRAQRERAIWCAAQQIEQGIAISKRYVAKVLKVDVSTISRMFPDDKLHLEALKLFNECKIHMQSNTPFAEMLKRKELRERK